MVCQHQIDIVHIWNQIKLKYYFALVTPKPMMVSQTYVIERPASGLEPHPVHHQIHKLVISALEGDLNFPKALRRTGMESESHIKSNVMNYYSTCTYLRLSIPQIQSRIRLLFFRIGLISFLNIWHLKQ